MEEIRTRGCHVYLGCQSSHCSISVLSSYAGFFAIYYNCQMLFDLRSTLNCYFQTFVFRRPVIFSRSLIFATAFMSFFSVVIALFKVMNEICVFPSKSKC